MKHEEIVYAVTMGDVFSAVVHRLGSGEGRSTGRHRAQSGRPGVHRKRWGAYLKH